jgi:predicted DCC family thiol-disulfide oxidoreductase YuxK
MSKTEITPKRIVFYDGECGFCNRTVAFVLKKQKGNAIYFTALQTEFAKRFFNERKITEIDFETFYFFSDDQLFERSDAALVLSKQLRFPFSLAIYLKWIPKSWRDGIYNYIAKNRKKLAGNYCFLPNEEQRKQFLD